MSGFTCVIGGRCAKGGVATKMFIISCAIRLPGDVVPEDAKKEDLAVFVEGPDKNIRNVNVMANAKAVYHIGFTPREAGQYWIDFVFRGEWAEKPIMFEICDAFNKVPNFPYQGIYRSQGGFPSQESVPHTEEEKPPAAKEKKVDDEKHKADAAEKARLDKEAADKAHRDKEAADKAKLEKEKKDKEDKARLEKEKADAAEKARLEKDKEAADKARVEKEKNWSGRKITYRKRKSWYRGKSSPW